MVRRGAPDLPGGARAAWEAVEDHRRDDRHPHRCPSPHSRPEVFPAYGAPLDQAQTQNESPDSYAFHQTHQVGCFATLCFYCLGNCHESSARLIVSVLQCFQCSYSYSVFKGIMAILAAFQTSPPPYQLTVDGTRIPLLAWQTWWIHSMIHWCLPRPTMLTSTTPSSGWWMRMRRSCRRAACLCFQISPWEELIWKCLLV